VEANFHGSGNFFPGKVNKVRPDGKYDILFDDGDTEDGVKRSYIRVIDAAPPSSASPAAQPSGLSDAQRDQVMQIFRWADHNRDSYLNEEEFQLWCDRTGLGDLYDQCVSRRFLSLKSVEC